MKGHEICKFMEIYKDAYPVKWTANVNWAVLNHVVNNFGNGCGEVRVGELWMKEDFGPKEALIPDINAEWLLSDAVDPLVLFDPFRRFLVILRKLFCQVGANIRITLLQ